MSPRLTVLTVALLAPAALANLRAPQVIPASPSSALGGGAPGVRVLGEALRFDCGAPEAHECTVEARYRVEAAAAVELALDFVLPVDQPVSATVAAGDQAKPQAVQVERTRWLSYDEAEAERRKGTPPSRLHIAGRSDQPPLYQARFTASLAAGAGTITVRYRQPLEQRERGHGYGRKGRFVDGFQYELWPITGWELAPDFRLVTTITQRRAPPNWWKRTFGKVRSAACAGRGGATDGGAKLPGTTAQGDGELVYTLTLDRRLPDVLECGLGDADLVP